MTPYSQDILKAFLITDDTFNIWKHYFLIVGREEKIMIVNDT
jgi:hypothetical protein